MSEGGAVGVAEGADVSVRGAVDVNEMVGVALGAKGVNDSVGNGGMPVGEETVAGTEGAVRLQAKEVIIKSVERTRSRLIGKVDVPFRKDGSGLW